MPFLAAPLIGIRKPISLYQSEILGPYVVLSGKLMLIYPSRNPQNNFKPLCVSIGLVTGNTLFEAHRYVAIFGSAYLQIG